VRQFKLHWLRCVGIAAVMWGMSGCTELGLWALNAGASFGHYERHDDLAYGPSKPDRFDLYLPPHAGNAPVVVFFFGGGWNSGDKAFYKFVGAALAEAGIIVVIPNYTLYPEARFPQYMRDAASAVAWAHAHAREWGGDPQRLFVIGHSAGAQIAVLLALDQQYLQQVGGDSGWLRGIVGLSGPYNFLPFTEDYLNDLFGPPAAFPRSQPINYVRADAPPLLLMHGLRDKRVSPNNTRSLTAAMQAVGGRVSTRYFPDAGHGDTVAALVAPVRRHYPVLPDILAFIAGQGLPD
jgi:acetyl esterase/lipase